MKILHVSYLDNSGGANIAARRICEAQLNNGISAKMLVCNKSSSKPFVYEVSFKRKLFNMFANMVGQILAKKQKKPTNEILHSLNIFPSKMYHVINSSDCDVVNLHWINAEFIRIEDLKKINKPIVWTLHDMWPFSGSEHYEDLTYPERYKSGYQNRPSEYSGFDFDNSIFKRKLKSYPNNMHIICPSKWMSECSSSSLLLGDKKNFVVPNTLDSNIFKPQNIEFGREQLSFAKDKKLVLFGAFNSKDDPRKGYKFIRQVIDILNESPVAEKIEFIIYGSEQRDAEYFGKIKANFIGKFSDEISLASIYSSVDVFVAPSMQDNLPNTILEAQACGTPTAAFDIGGISDLVVDNVTGKLAVPFDVKQLAENILSLLDMDISNVCKKHFDENYSEKVVSDQYKAVYEKILNR